MSQSARTRPTIHAPMSHRRQQIGSIVAMTSDSITTVASAGRHRSTAGYSPNMMNGSLWVMKAQHAPTPSVRQSAAVPFHRASMSAQRTKGTRTLAAITMARAVSVALRKFASVPPRTRRGPHRRRMTGTSRASAPGSTPTTTRPRPARSGGLRSAASMATRPSWSRCWTCWPRSPGWVATSTRSSAARSRCASPAARSNCRCGCRSCCRARSSCMPRSSASSWARPPRSTPRAKRSALGGSSLPSRSPCSGG